VKTVKNFRGPLFLPHLVHSGKPSFCLNSQSFCG